MKTAAIVICAYDCAEFIPDLIDGILSQHRLKDWTYDFRIGSDACAKTSEALGRMKFNHFIAVKNVGHAILRNALIYQAPADAFLYFDADDKMMPDYCRKNIEALRPGVIVMPAKINCDAALRPKTGRAVIENGGAMTFGQDVIKAVGGFAPFRCAIDTDLMRRAEMAGMKITEIPEALYYRRAHPKALTKAKTTGMGSDYRSRVWAEMTAARKAGRVYYEPELVKINKVSCK